MGAFESTGPSSYSSASDARATLREVVAAFRRDRKWIVRAFALTMLAFIVFSFIPKPMYQSTSSLLVKIGREYIYTPENRDGNAQPMSLDRDQTLHAEVQILTSRDVIDRALSEVGIDKVYPSIANKTSESPEKRMDIAAEQVSKHLKAEVLKDSNVIQVTFSHPNSAIAALVVNRIVADYLARRRTIFANPRSAFLEEQVGKYRQRLTQVESDLAQFRREHNVVLFDHELGQLVDERQALKTKLGDAVQDMDSSRTRAQMLKKSLATVPTDVMLWHERSPTEAVDTAKQKLLDLQLKERDLTSKFYDNNPLVMDVRKDIANTQSFIREQQAQPRNTVRSGRNQVRDAIETDLIRARADASAAAARRTARQEQLSTVNGRIAELSALQPRFNDLMREEKLVENGYIENMRKLQDARVMDERDQKAQANVSIIQSGLRPAIAKSYRWLIIGIGLIVSLFVALLVAFVLALMRQTFLVPKDVERWLGLPVLAEIPATH